MKTGTHQDEYSLIMQEEAKTGLAAAYCLLLSVVLLLVCWL